MTLLPPPDIEAIWLAEARGIAVSSAEHGEHILPTPDGAVADTQVFGGATDQTKYGPLVAERLVEDGVDQRRVIPDLVELVRMAKQGEEGRCEEAFVSARSRPVLDRDATQS